MPARRFPPPWSVDEMNDACFIVRDANGRRSAISISRMSRAHVQRRILLTKDEARPHLAVSCAACSPTAGS